jgi:subtilisin family serine protease
VSSAAIGKEIKVSDFAAVREPEMWRRLQGSDQRAVIGLKAPDRERGMWGDQVLVDAAQLSKARAALVAREGVELLAEDDVRPVVTVRFQSADAMESVRKLPFVDYLEPASFPGQLTSGCTGINNPAGGDPYSGPTDEVAQGDLLPVLYNYSRIKEAWDWGATGAGVTVAVLDTGVFQEQLQLFAEANKPGGRFTAGMSTDRSVVHINATDDPNPWDKCNHGTRMASVVANPRDGSNMVGIAWKANLIKVKVGNDVFADHVETNFIVKGIRQARTHGARIIAMAFGTGSWSYRNIEDEIRLGTNTSSNPVLFVGAAGTEYCLEGVMFPAKMPEVVAVTGLTPAGTLHPTACGGPEVDVGAVITNAFAAGRYPTNQMITFGGSSAATAVVAGIAALVWSRNPTWSPQQVRHQLVSTAANAGSSDPVVGFGLIDAYKAVGGSGPTKNVRYRNIIKMRHRLTTNTLHSHALNYVHPGTSGQQQVTAFAGSDDNDLWRVKGPDGQPEIFKVGEPVQHGDIIRLEHVLTGRNLHSHGGFPSPVTHQQEVTCYGDNGIGDANDNWRIEIEGGGTWDSGKRLRLKHVTTNHALHSHLGFSHPDWTAGQQEVTGFAQSDDNDWWFFEGGVVGSPIRAKHSGKVLDVAGISMANGARLQQWDYLDGNNQKWTLESVGGGYYKIVSQLSGKVLDVVGRSTANGARLQQWDYLGRDNQKWRLDPLGDGYYKIVAKHSGKVLDVVGRSTANGAQIQQYDYLGRDNQRWKL